MMAIMRGPQTRGGWWISKPRCGQTRTLPTRRKIEQAALSLVPVGSLSACNITNFVSSNIILTKMGLGPWCWWWGWCIAVIVALGHYDKVPAIQRRTIPLSWGIFPCNWCWQWWSGKRWRSSSTRWTATSTAGIHSYFLLLEQLNNFYWMKKTYRAGTVFIPNFPAWIKAIERNWS